MVSKCFAVITLISFVYAVFAGNTGALTAAVLDGAAGSVHLSLELCGMSCLWCGILRVFADSGILDRVSRILSPLMKHLFPKAWRTGAGKREITAAVSANLLGIGNAATPYALAAMRELDRVNPSPGKTTEDMAAFAVLGTASLNLIPTTLLTLRRAAGSADPAAILVPVWIGSLCTAAAGMLLCRALGKVCRRTAKGGRA